MSDPDQSSATSWSLVALAAIGLLGACCVLLGVLQPGSPFVAHGPSSWFFTASAVQASTREGSRQFLGIMLVYLGIALMLGAWLETLHAVRVDSRITVRQLFPLLLAWAAPIVFAPPLFSRDVYSYAAQGQMVSKGLDPYLHGPNALGSSTFLSLVDPLWRNATSPYGPAWERLSGWIVQLSGHDILGALLDFRLVAAVGIGLLAWGVPALARAHGRNEVSAFTLAVLNPLVVLVLLGGAHNDALMLGLLAAACAMASRGHVLLGLASCALASEVKAPAVIAAVFIGWAWWGAGSSGRQRLAKTAFAVLFSLAGIVVIGAVSGLSWRWMGDLFGAGTVVSWLDPVTAVGLALGHMASALGYHGAMTVFIDSTRIVGLGLAVLLALRLLAGPRGMEPTQALGWSLIAFVLLGPIIWPWYETWGFIFLAVAAEGWTFRFVVILSAIACFADMPSPHLLVSAPLSVAVFGWAVLAGLVFAYFARRRPLAMASPILLG